MISTLGLYFFQPVPDILFPIGLIGSCFLFIIVTVAWQLLALPKPDLSLDLKSVIENTLNYNAKINRRQCQYTSVIISASFVGGFLLGLILQGWTLLRIISNPILVVVMVLLTVLSFYWTKGKAFRKFNRSLNPRYQQIKSHLEEQLTALN